MTYIQFDVMETINGDERYICSMKMPYNRAFPVPMEEWEAFVIQQRPSLAHRNFVIRL